jgi:hypothetical protein
VRFLRGIMAILRRKRLVVMSLRSAAETHRDLRECSGRSVRQAIVGTDQLLRQGLSVRALWPPVGEVVEAVSVDGRSRRWAWGRCRSCDVSKEKM